MDKILNIADKKFSSKLMIGTGKFSSSKVMAEAIEASGAEIVTVALRRVDVHNDSDDVLTNIPSNALLLPNTSGAINASEAVRLAKIARVALGGNNWVKLEVTPDPYTLLPCPIETYEAACQLIELGFNVMPYINADPILAKKLESAGCVTVMPLAAPIGTNKGLTTRDAISIIIEQANVPVVVDAGLGAPSHAAEAIELGADAVLVNTAIAIADDPVLMAKAFKLAVEGAYLARKAGLAPVSKVAEASSPLTGFLKNLE